MKLRIEEISKENDRNVVKDVQKDHRENAGVPTDKSQNLWYIRAKVNEQHTIDFAYLDRGKYLNCGPLFSILGNIQAQDYFDSSSELGYDDWVYGLMDWITTHEEMIPRLKKGDTLFDLPDGPKGHVRINNRPPAPSGLGPSQHLDTFTP